MKIKILALILMVYDFVSSQNASDFTIHITDSHYIAVKDSNFICHSSSILQLDENSFMVVWFEGSFEGAANVKIMSSKYNFFNGTTINTPSEIVAENDSFACWNPVLQRLNNKEILLFYKIGKNPREWIGACKKSKDNGLTWEKEIILPIGFIGPVKNKGIILSDSILLFPSSIETNDNKWQVHLEYFNIRNNNWSGQWIDNDTFGLIQPTILQYNNDSLQLLCRSRQNAIVQLWSSNGGKTWSKPKSLNMPNPNSGIDAADWNDEVKLLVYNPMNAGKEWWGGRSELRLALSFNGIQWKDLMVLEKHSNGEYSYPAIIVSPDKSVYICYTFNRKAIKVVRLKIEEK